MVGRDNSPAERATTASVGGLAIVGARTVAVSATVLSPLLFLAAAAAASATVAAAAVSGSPRVAASAKAAWVARMAVASCPQRPTVAAMRSSESSFAQNKSNITIGLGRARPRQAATAHREWPTVGVGKERGEHEGVVRADNLCLRVEGGRPAEVAAVALKAGQEGRNGAQQRRELAVRREETAR